MKKRMNEEDIPVVQWIRICLSMQGRGFYPWARKIPHAWKITKTKCRNHRALTLQSLRTVCSRAPKPQE